MDDVSETLSGQAGLLCELLTSAIEPHLKRADMTLSTFELLSTVHALRNRGTQADVARRLGITPPSLSESVKAAQKMGLVDQVPSTRDGRAKVLHLSPLGTKSLNAVLRAVRTAETEMLAGLSASDTAVAIRVLRQANKNLARGLQDS